MMTNVVAMNKAQEEGAPVPQIYAAILAINAEIPSIPKKKKGDGLRYDAYVTEEIVKTVKPIMLRHNVFVVSRGVERATEYSESNGKPLARHYVFMNHVFFHADGSSIETSTFGEGSGFNDEGLAKAHTRSLGAALREIFLICEEEGVSKPSGEGETRTSADFFAAAERQGITRPDAVKILNQYRGKDQLRQAFAHLAAAPASTPVTAPVASPPATDYLSEWRAAVQAEKDKLPHWHFKKIVCGVLQLDEYYDGAEFQAIERDREPLLSKLRAESGFIAAAGKPKFNSTTYWQRVAELKVGKEAGTAIVKKWTANNQIDWAKAMGELERSASA